MNRFSGDRFRVFSCGNVNSLLAVRSAGGNHR
jgi:hypothetical protein